MDLPLSLRPTSGIILRSDTPSAAATNAGRGRTGRMDVEHRK